VTTVARIVRKPGSWSITILTDPQSSTIVFEAIRLAINNANGKFRMNARGVDGGHMAAMVDVVLGPEDPKDYAGIDLGAMA